MEITKNLKKEIEAAIEETDNIKYARRLQAILHSGGGKSNKEIATLLGVSDESVRRWIEKFKEEGFLELRDCEKSGRPPKLSPAMKSQLKQELQKSPTSFGYAHPFWTIELLQYHVQQLYDIEISGTTAHRHLQSSENRAKKPTLIEPDKAKEQFVKNLKSSANEGKNHIWHIDKINLGKIPIKLEAAFSIIETRPYYLYCAFKMDPYNLQTIGFYPSAVHLSPLEDWQPEYLRFVRDLIREKLKMTNNFLFLVFHHSPWERQLLEKIGHDDSNEKRVRVLFTPIKSLYYPQTNLFLAKDILAQEIKKWITEIDLGTKNMAYIIHKKSEEIVNQRIIGNRG